MPLADGRQGLTASLKWRTLLECKRWGTAMTKSMLLLITLFFAVSPGAAGAQTVNQGGTQGSRTVPGNQGLIGIPPTQSISPPTSACSTGSQSVRVCNNDFSSCSSACTAVLLSDPSADTTGCTQRCCTGLNACLSLRGCGNLNSVNCFTFNNGVSGSFQ
jgi:hypothetical protein